MEIARQTSAKLKLFTFAVVGEALAAVAGDIHQATDRLLNHNRHPPPPPPPDSTPPNVQPKINRFFNFNPRKDLIPPKIHHESEETEKNEQSPTLIHRKQRQRSPGYQQSSPAARAAVRADAAARSGRGYRAGPPPVRRFSPPVRRLPSVILWGPPGTEKTFIARANVNSCTATSGGGGSSYRLISLSAVTCGVKEVREAVEAARRRISHQRTVLFLDEVHRFNKAQQDSFLPVIEDGSIVFIGATTENPSFHLITPLLSQ